MVIATKTSNMKYASISITIVGIWIISTIAIISRDNVSPTWMSLIALGNTIWLAILGFRATKHPEL